MRTSGTVTAAGPRSSAATATASALSTGAVTAGSVTDSSLGVSGAMSAAGLSTSGAVTTVGSHLLGGDGVYTLARPVHSTAFKGRSTVIISGDAASTGGDLVLEA